MRVILDHPNAAGFVRRDSGWCNNFRLDGDEIELGFAGSVGLGFC